MTLILIANGLLMATVTTGIVGMLARAIKPVRPGGPVLDGRARRPRLAFA